ncbi:D-ribose ABC transporter substrate-binding protein [Pullulanibacillus sp. KACC 23026]|uniref:D-ribose ABC transporter substrate-binding protein n=1 Tax=Pullulanibacillus sp. KACC 23026 TaxID=3028315 RepID=UPI0023B1C71F|nr:D-ribose ABC transporter substrate-binding protein [Pullulanibacillus sp. KACC 23026]WEG13326.1 D-ribose ABC transporter substrate-binding protein [Pullulanibacillus sp. KACC 23026]
MKKKLSLILVAALTAVMVTACGSSSSQNSSSSSDSSSKSNSSSQKTVGLAVSTLNNPFFVSMRDGAKSEADKKGIHLIVDNANNDQSTQLNQVQDLIQQKVGAILLNPVDSQGLAQAVKMANQANIPVITLDRSVSSGKVTTFIASDSVKAGKMAADQIIKALNGKGKVVELQGEIGASSERDREKGFDNEIKTASGIQVVSKQSADFDRSKALNVMENILQAHPDVNAVFAQNDEMALGALKAIQQSNKKNVKIVGIDGEGEAIKNVNNGSMYADIAQQPSVEGQLGVDKALDLFNGKKLDSTVPVPLKLVTKGSSFKGF